jgi:S1-C subfamily serine protease
MPAELIELSNALAQITERAARSAVAVHTEARGSSSGIVWRPGVIVTAEHALRRDEEIQVTLPDGRIVPAVLGGRDSRTDLAVLKCAEAGAALPEFGDVALLKPGSITLVVGRTRASGPVAALAIVSLVAPERRTWTGAALAPYIRLDVGLQPTAVGGLVIDAHGKASGVATTKFARFGAIAIPAHTVSAVVDTLLEKGRIPRGYLGVGLQSLRLPETLRQSLQRNEKTAAIVLDVEPNGPAHQAGIVIGDILVSFGGRQVAQLEDIQSQLHGEMIGKRVSVELIRGGALQEVSILIGERLHGRE